MDPVEIFTALQVVVGIARALSQTGDPSPEQLAALDSIEGTIKAKLDADLADEIAMAKTAQI